MKDFNFMEELSIKDREYLLKKSKYIELEKNTILFNQGDTCSDILFLQEGKVKLFMYRQIDEVVPLYEINKGEQCIINISSTLSKTEAIASAETITSIKAYLVPSSVVRSLMLSSSSYQEYVFSLFSLKFRALTIVIEDIKFKKLDERVLEYLKSFNNKLIEITHEELAVHLGTSRVVISRVLKDLERNGFLKLYRKRIELI